jgi:hypothetical protein
VSARWKFLVGTHVARRSLRRSGIGDVAEHGAREFDTSCYATHGTSYVEVVERRRRDVDALVYYWASLKSLSTHTVLERKVEVPLPTVW